LETVVVVVYMQTHQGALMIRESIVRRKEVTEYLSGIFTCCGKDSGERWTNSLANMKNTSNLLYILCILWLFRNGILGFYRGAYELYLTGYPDRIGDIIR
jgi:hypothetical protein